MQHLAPANGVIEGDPHQECSLANAVPGHDDADIARAYAAMDRVFEQSERIAFVKFFAIHTLFLVYSSPFIHHRRQPGRCRTSQPVPCELRTEPQHTSRTPSCISL